MCCFLFTFMDKEDLGRGMEVDLGVSFIRKRIRSDNVACRVGI